MASVTHQVVSGRQINAADYAAEHQVTIEASDITGALGYTPADAAHNHDDRYYTEAEIDAFLAAIDADITSIESTLATHTQQITDIINQLQDEPVLNGLISGGVVTWDSALTFRVSAAVYYIQGVRYVSPEQTVTLSAAHATLNRIDVLALDTSLAFVVVPGTAATTPSEPDVDPATQLRLTFVSVDATVTAPAGVTITNIYLENTEWTTSTSGSGINTNSTNNPKSGTKCVEATNMGNGAYALFDKGAVDLNINQQRVLRLFIRSKAAFANNRFLRLQWYANGVAKGIPVTLASGYWGFDSSNIAGYQVVAIPIEQFNVPLNTLIDQLRVTDIGGAIGFYIDEITLESYASSVGGGDPNQHAPLLLVPTEITGTSYSTVAADTYASKLCTNAALCTVTLTSDPPIGSRIRVMAMGAGGFTFAAGSGMTQRSRDGAYTSAGQYAVAEAHRISSTEWAILGDVA